MVVADLVLLLANVVYATSYVAVRVTVDDVPPATLAFVRLVVGALILLPLGARAERVPPRPGDTGRVVAMGLVGFAAAYALAHWGILHSTATHAALLIVIEPVALMLLAPLVLGERLARRDGAAAVLALLGATLVVVNGMPGGSPGGLLPHWRGDALLVLSAVAFAAYSLLGRAILTRHNAARVTRQSIAWGAAGLAPLAIAEWLSGQRPVWTPTAVAGTLYLAIVISALGYLVWNWALARVEASRAATFLTVQPLGGAVLGVLLLGETVTVFTVTGASLIVAGLCMTVRWGR
ncbi:MAG: DMT family transporter [Candidatus Rokuibacteriota bacterium]